MPETDKQILADLALIEKAAKGAGHIALEFFKKDPDVWYKGKSRSPVSEADIKIDAFLKDVLVGARPDYGWLSEEIEDDFERLDKEYIFIVDPIDGTRAFIHGTDEWCISIGIVKDGQPVCGVLYAPVQNNCYRASLNGGAYIDGRKLMPPKVDRALHNVVVPDEVEKKVDPRFCEKIVKVGGARSLALRLVGLPEQKADGIFVRKNSHDWDLVAADLILKEAGYCLVDQNGHHIVYNDHETNHGLLFAASPSYIDVMIKALVDPAG